MIGTNIKKLRQQKKLSQEKLARLTDISLNALTKIESGFTKRPSVQTIYKLAKALVKYAHLPTIYMKDDVSQLEDLDKNVRT